MAPMQNYQNWHPNFPVDLKNCHEEPIRIPGAIQTFGVLIGYDKQTGFIRTLSENTLSYFPEFKNFETENIHLFDFVTKKITDVKFTLSKNVHNRQLVEIETTENGIKKQRFGVIYTSGALEILELEMVEQKDKVGYSDYFRDLPLMLQDIQSCESIQELAHATATRVKEISGFDRVMIYKYDSDWNGEVIAEAKEERLEAYLGLHYPASDIPPQARALYEKNWIRIIPTMHYTPSVLIPKSHQTLDLSDSILRSVSPIHIRYLQNMGVGASMSISLMVDNKLWGLVACHHYSGEHFVPVNLRLSCEAYGQLVSAHVRTLESQAALLSREYGEASLHEVLGKFGATTNFKAAARLAEEEILAMFDCDSVIISLGDEKVILGKDPGEQVTQAVAKAIDKNTILEPLVSSSISQEPYLKSVEFDSSIAGFMALSLSSRHNYYIVCFRPEEIETVNWAGKPKTKIERDFSDPDQRLIPRGSFDLWAETNKGKSRRWSNEVIDLLRRFGLLFVKIVIERKEIVEKSNHELKALNQTKDEFVATVSHELRTPLNAIIGWSELALSGELHSDQYMEALKVIQRNARSQNQLISDLLDVSRIISGKMRLSVKSIRVSEIAEAVIQSFLPACDAKNIKILTAFDNFADSIIGDAGRIQQVFWNLISNAVKFSPKNSKIWVTVKRIDSHIDIRVQDQGTGIEPENLEMIFGQFSQVDSSISRKAGGLGLGLAISKHIVELHGGSIMAFSEGLNKGTSFSVMLPIAPVASEVSFNHMPVDDDFEVTTQTKPSQSTRLAGHCILIVEDEPDALKFLDILIKTHGATTYTASNGNEALAVLEIRKDEITLILSDVGMPFMDGHQFMQNVRQSPDDKIRAMFSVALTAFGRPQDRISALKAGFNSYITKPVMQEELLTVLEAAKKTP